MNGYGPYPHAVVVSYQIATKAVTWLHKGRYDFTRINELMSDDVMFCFKSESDKVEFVLRWA